MAEKSNKKKLGRPKIFKTDQERYLVANKRKPVIRVTPEEKKLIELLRKQNISANQVMESGLTPKNSVTRNDKVLPEISKVVTTKPIITKVVTTKKKTHYKNKDIKINEADQEVLGFLKQIYPESVKRGPIIDNTNLSREQVRHRLDTRGKFIKIGLIEKAGGNQHDGFLYKLNLEKYNQVFDDSE